VKLLLDTNVLIWGLDAPERLSAKAVAAIRSASSVVSIVSHWEIAIKRSIGRLPSTFGVVEWQQAAGLDLLPVRLEHVSRVADLPLHHRDPFDRMLIAQALVEGFTLVTSDRMFDRYGVPTIAA
jgi:PIN domain nuclease of toxin-antitoxin system